MVLYFNGKSHFLPVPVSHALLQVSLFLIPCITTAQQAELAVNVFDPLNTPASGLVSVVGPDTSVEKELVNGTALFYLDGITAIENVDRDEQMRLYPNPAGSDGKVIMAVPSFDGRIEVFNAYGRKIFEGNTGDMELSFPFEPGIGIILYTSPEGDYAAFKIVNPASHILSLTIKKNKSSPTKNTRAADGYTITYSDPWQDLEETSCTRIISPGAHFTENMQPGYSIKTATVTGKTSGTSLLLVKNTADEIIGFYETGSDGKINPFPVEDAFSKKTGENVKIEISGYDADTLLLTVHINQEDTVRIYRLLNRHYYVKINCSTPGFGFTVSDKDGFLGSGTSQVSFKKEADSLSVDITGSASGYKTSWLKGKLIKPGISWYSMSLTLADSIFHHVLTLNISSSEAAEGHTVLNPYADIATSIGTVRKTFTNSTAVYAWDSDVKNESVTYDIGFEGNGHKDLAPATLTVGITPVTVTRVAEANDWTGNITFNVKDSKTNLNLNGASISTSQGKTGTTNTSGNATLTGYLIEENAYSEPINTAIGYSISKTDYVTAIGATQIIGGDKTVNVTLSPVPTFTHSLKVNLVSDEASQGHLVKDSTISFTTTLGTTTLMTSGQTVTYTWISKLEADTVIFDINVSSLGHIDVGAKKVAVGTTPVIENALIIARDFTGNITFQLTDSITNENVSGAVISTSQGKTGLTNETGTLTFTGYTIAENQYSEALSTPISYMILHDGYFNLLDSVKINPGDNNVPDTLAPVGARMYTHKLQVNLISDEAGEGHKVKDSPVTFTTARDTVTQTTGEQTTTYTWISNIETDSVVYDINVLGNGHADVGPKKVNVGIALVVENIILAGNDFTGSIDFNTKDSISTNNVSGAVITTAQNKTGVTDSIGNLTLTGYVIGENIYSEATDTLVPYTITHSGYYPVIDTVKITVGKNIVNDTLAPAGSRTYSHQLKINLVSDEAGEGHLVKDSPVSITTNQGTTTLPTAGQTISHSWNSSIETESVIYAVSVTGVGHADAGPDTVKVGIALATENVILAGNDFTGSITFNVKDSVTDANINGAVVSTSQGKTGITDTSGNLTLSGYVLSENTYSEPVSTAISYAITASGYTGKNSIATIDTGSHTVQVKLAPAPPTYAHSLTVNLISDEAGEGHKVKASPVTFTTSLGTTILTTGNQTVSHTWTSTLASEDVTYDINISGNGHIDPGIANITVGTTPVTENVTLTANDFTADIAFHVTASGSGTAISGAAISTDQGKNGTTDSNGDATITGYMIDENEYSEPVSTAIGYTITAAGYVTNNGNAGINAGSNTVNAALDAAK
jgi:hypothetical protein